MPRLEGSPTPRGREATFIQKARAFPGEVLKRYHALSPRRKFFIWGVAAVQVTAIIALIIITPTRIMQVFNDFGLKIRGMGVKGWFLCILLVVLASHPPLFGFAGSMSLIGFTYGIWPGFLIASFASMLGAAIAFLSVRTFFPKVKMGTKWDAFGNVIKHKGLPLIIMIRYSPIPWAIGNGLFASVESVKFYQFMIANLALQPRLFIPVFIGSRLTSLIETPDEPHHDPLKFWLNLGSIGLSMIISTGTGIWIYRLTLDQMRQLEEGELAARVLEEGVPTEGMYRDEMEMELDEDELEDEPLTSRQGLRPARPERGASRRTSGSGDDY